jgi:hypothetical protein
MKNSLDLIVYQKLTGKLNPEFILSCVGWSIQLILIIGRIW